MLSSCSVERVSLPGRLMVKVCAPETSAGLQGQVAVFQLRGYRLLDIVQVNIALVANGNHSATLELDIHGNAEDKAEHQHHGNQNAGEGVELFAVADKVDVGALVSLFAILGTTIQNGVAEHLVAGCTTDHNAGCKHAKDKVQQHTGEQREAEKSRCCQPWKDQT